MRLLFAGGSGTMCAMRWLAEKYLRWRGWELVGVEPPYGKFLAVAAPHTSNWDFVGFLGVARHFRIPARVIGKHSLVRGPFGPLMRRLGIIPVERDTGQGLVQQMVGEYAAADRMALVIAPEGTRRAAPFWRSGFHRIATAAGVPIVLTFLDYEHKRGGIGPIIEPTGQMEDDMATIAAFYEGMKGKNPENQGPIRLEQPDTA